MNLVVLSQLELILCDKWCYLFDWVEYSSTYLSFASFNVPYKQERIMYELLILRIIWCVLWPEKYGAV